MFIIWILILQCFFFFSNNSSLIGQYDSSFSTMPFYFLRTMIINTNEIRSLNGRNSLHHTISIGRNQSHLVCSSIHLLDAREELKVVIYFVVLCMESRTSNMLGKSLPVSYTPLHSSSQMLYPFSILTFLRKVQCQDQDLSSKVRGDKRQQHTPMTTK